MEHVFSAVNVVLPVFLVIAVGYLLKQKKVINQSFVDMAMKIIFNVGLPGMLFTKISKADISSLSSSNSYRFVAYAFVMTLLVFFMAKGFAKFSVKDQASYGTFVQGSFRSNYIIIGSSVLYSMFGDASTIAVAMLMIVIIPTYNILSIWVLSEDADQHPIHNLKVVLVKVIKNPLIIAIVLGFVAALLKVKIPVAIASSIAMLGSIGTPLGLIGIGAYLDFRQLEGLKVSLVAVMLKLILIPFIATVGAILLGFSYMEVTVIFILFGSPAAISSFIMATALGGNSKMAANIVIVGTALSMVTYIIGLSGIGLFF